MARLKPEEILDRYPQFIANINSFVRSDDIGLKHVAVETFGFLGSTPKGKLALQRIGEVLPVFFPPMIKRVAY